MYYMDLIKGEREDHDESQRDLAAILGITQYLYWCYETGKHEMPIRHLIAICNHYKVSADYLLGIPYNYRKPR